MPLQAHWANRWLHNRRTDLVLCTAQVIYDQYADMAGFDRAKVRLLHDGVDTGTFRPGLTARSCAGNWYRHRRTGDRGGRQTA